MSHKYDWSELKKGFFESEYLQISTYLREVHSIIYSGGQIAKITKGWTKEKAQYKKALLDQSKEMAIETMAKKEGEAISKHVQNIKRSLINMTNALQGTVMLKIKRHIDEETNKVTPYFEDDDVRVIKDIYPIIKTELGEASNIIKTNTTIDNIDTIIDHIELLKRAK